MFTYDGANPKQRAEGLTHAVAAARRGELVCANIDGAYALLADAFSWRGLERIGEVKGRPGMGAPVLVGRIDTVDGVAALAGESAVVARDLMRACWPGPLTLLARVQPSLPWKATPDGVIALRMPLHPWTLELVRALGPTACVPAHAPGEAAFASMAEAQAVLGEAVGTYLDGGPCLPDQASSIVDVTGEQALLVREGAFTREHLTSITPDLG